MVGCFPERRGFSASDGQLRRLAAYCTVEVRRRAQTRVFIGRTGTCGEVLLQGGTCAAAQSTGRGSPRKSSLRWISRTPAGRAPGRSSTRRRGRRHLGRTRHCRERRREGLLLVCWSALRPGRRRRLANAAGGRRGGRAMLSPLAQITLSTGLGRLRVRHSCPSRKGSFDRRP